MRRLLFILLLVCIGAPATAGTISFDEIAPANSNWTTLGEEYAGRGFHFLTTDDGAVWSGVSDGDPGGWALEGTNGSAFIGFNGRSYDMAVLIDESVENFNLDVTRAAGSTTAVNFTLVGFENGNLVDEVTVDLGGAAVNEWITIGLVAPVDEVQMYGVGDQAFGVDNFVWGADDPGPDPDPDPDPEPEVIPVEIDVRPGRSDRINPFSAGVVPVALFGSEIFDVEAVDPDSLGLGPNGAPVFDQSVPHVKDLNGDGFDDILCHHPVPMTGIAMGDTEVCLTGMTWDGDPFAGCTTVSTVPKQDAASAARKLEKRRGHRRHDDKDRRGKDRDHRH